MRSGGRFCPRPAFLISELKLMASSPSQLGYMFAGYSAGDVIVQKYRLVRLLGEGGVEAVWLAYNLVLQAPVALKLIRPGVDAPDAAERLLKEAHAEARLEHPAIVRAFDFGRTEEGSPFIVMELLEGRNLASVLDQLK